MLRQQSGQAIQAITAFGQPEDIDHACAPGQRGGQRITSTAGNDVQVDMRNMLIGRTAIIDDHVVCLHIEARPFLGANGATRQLEQVRGKVRLQMLQQNVMAFGNNQTMRFTHGKQIQHHQRPLITVHHTGRYPTISDLAEYAIAHPSSPRTEHFSLEITAVSSARADVAHRVGRRNVVKGHRQPV